MSVPPPVSLTALPSTKPLSVIQTKKLGVDSGTLTGCKGTVSHPGILGRPTIAFRAATVAVESIAFQVIVREKPNLAVVKAELLESRLAEDSRFRFKQIEGLPPKQAACAAPAVTKAARATPDTMPSCRIFIIWASYTSSFTLLGYTLPTPALYQKLQFNKN